MSSATTIPFVFLPSLAVMPPPTALTRSSVYTSTAQPLQPMTFVHSAPNGPNGRGRLGTQQFPSFVYLVSDNNRTFAFDLRNKTHLQETTQVLQHLLYQSAASIRAQDQLTASIRAQDQLTASIRAHEKSSVKSSAPSVSQTCPVGNSFLSSLSAHSTSANVLPAPTLVPVMSDMTVPTTSPVSPLSLLATAATAYSAPATLSASAVLVDVSIPLVSSSFGSTALADRVHETSSVKICHKVRAHKRYVASKKNARLERKRLSNASANDELPEPIIDNTKVYNKENEVENKETESAVITLNPIVEEETTNAAEILMTISNSVWM